MKCNECGAHKPLDAEKKWVCDRKKHYVNTVEMSLMCYRCSNPRPKNTLPYDVMFPLFVPLDTSKEVKHSKYPKLYFYMNKYAMIFEKLLSMVDIIDERTTLDTHDKNKNSLDFKLKQWKKDEKMKAAKKDKGSDSEGESKP